MAQNTSALRDNFDDNVVAPAWSTALTVGSATTVETTGQAVITLPSSTAGAHTGQYQSVTTYDLTSDAMSVNVPTMVNTAVSANAFMDAAVDLSNYLRIAQQSGTIFFQAIVGGGTTTLFSVAYSNTTHRWWRIREASGTVYFDTSTSASGGAAWTQRASVLNPFAVTALFLRFGASCGNVASPGQAKFDDFNKITLTSTWHWTQVEWPLLYRFKTITLAASSGQGYVATSNDGTTWAYYSGPLGSSTGFNQLAPQASQAAALAAAVDIPADDRWDLPTIVECRYIKLFHRSTNGATYRIDEYYPRRLVQSDDIEAESIRAINIAAGAITADKIFVLSLAAITATMGTLNMTGVISIGAAGGIYQGTGTFAAPTTGLKLFSSGGIGKLSTYNAGVEQVTFDTDGKLKAGAGEVILDAGGVSINTSTSGGYATANAIKFYDGSAVAGAIYTFRTASTYATRLYAGDSTAGHYGNVLLTGFGKSGFSSTQRDPFVAISGAQSAVVNSSITIDAYDVTINAVRAITNALYPTTITASGGINVGTATGAATGQISTSGSVGVGAAVATNVRLLAKGASSTNVDYALAALDSASTTMFYVKNDSTGYLNAVSWSYSSDERLKEAIKDLDRGLPHLAALRPKKFDYKDGAKNQMGFLAADVKLIMPELVVPIDTNDTSPTPMLGMLTSGLIPVIVAAVQELAARVEALEKK